MKYSDFKVSYEALKDFASERFEGYKLSLNWLYPPSGNYLNLPVREDALAVRQEDPLIAYSPVSQCDGEGSFDHLAIFRNPNAVNQFLKLHPGISSQVRTAIEILKDRFDTNEIVVEVDRDPESFDPDETLFVTAITDKDVAESTRLLDEADERLFHELKFNPSVINIDVDFK